MANQDALLMAIDQGTTSSRAIIFDRAGAIQALAQQEFAQHYPQDGWVEHDPEDLWQTTLQVCREALEQAPTVAAIGITNQRETTLLWDRQTGECLYKAIVWQDRRTAKNCEQLKADGYENLVTERSGLLLDPYFSGTKLAWLLDNVKGARALADKGRLAFGTVDCFLLWRLTGGRVHATDATNASRTMLFNIHNNSWDDELLRMLNIPESVLPEVKDSSADYGTTDPTLLGKSIPICGIAGDQQAATIGQACFKPGMVKSTYGTGCFVVLNTGEQALRSNNRMLTTIAYRLNGKTSYAIEGSIFIAGAAVQWLRDSLKLIGSAAETEALAKQVNDSQGVYLVPAFTGLGAPYWDANARGALFGLTRDTGIPEIVHATLESVCYQTNDLLQAMADDGLHPTTLRVDGGMVSNNWLMQTLADTLNIQVARPVITETTALGAAQLAGLQIGIYDSLDALQNTWQLDAEFTPKLDAQKRNAKLAGWQKAVARVRES